MDAESGFGDEEELSTVFVGGLPLDATHRELDNLCRFLPGFINSKVDTRRGTTLFARFDSHESAQAAIAVLHNQPFDRNNPTEPMRVVMAKSNMRTNEPPAPTSGGYPVQQWQIVPTQYQPPPPGKGGGTLNGAFGDARPAKRPRIPENPTQVDTLACVGATEAGFSEATLEAFFSRLPGFTAFKGNPRMGGAFVKFATAVEATQAMVVAEDHGIPAAIAKSSMSAPPAGAGTGGATVAPTIVPAFQASQPYQQEWTPSLPADQGAASRPKRFRMPENPAEVDTVASVGAAEVGIDETTLQKVFMALPGFLAFKPNPRMGGGFAKFASADLAAQAIASVQEQGVPAAMAKSSMSVMN